MFWKESCRKERIASGCYGVGHCELGSAVNVRQCFSLHTVDAYFVIHFDNFIVLLFKCSNHAIITVCVYVPHTE